MCGSSVFEALQECAANIMCVSQGAHQVLHAIHNMCYFAALVADTQLTNAASRQFVSSSLLDEETLAARIDAERFVVQTSI